MGEPTPAENLSKIIELDGKVNTLQARVEGEMNRQSEAIEAMKDVTERIENTMNDFSEKMSNHTSRLFDKSDSQGKKVVGLEARFTGHEQLCEQRDRSIHEKISSEFKGLKQALHAEKTAESRGKNDRRYLITTIITVIIAIIGWLIAFL